MTKWNIFSRFPQHRFQSLLVLSVKVLQAVIVWWQWLIDGFIIEFASPATFAIILSWNFPATCARRLINSSYLPSPPSVKSIPKIYRISGLKALRGMFNRCFQTTNSTRERNKYIVIRSDARQTDFNRNWLKFSTAEIYIRSFLVRVMKTPASSSAIFRILASRQMAHLVSYLFSDIVGEIS